MRRRGFEAKQRVVTGTVFATAASSISQQPQEA